MISILKAEAPKILTIVYTEDLGFEFTAILNSGVIFAMPGMLLSDYGGNLPILEWEQKSEQENTKELQKFLENGCWEVIPWNEIQTSEIEELFHQI
jgi:hypothetical protein